MYKIFFDMALSRLPGAHVHRTIGMHWYIFLSVDIYDICVKLAKSLPMLGIYGSTPITAQTLLRNSTTLVMHQEHNIMSRYVS